MRTEANDGAANRREFLNFLVAGGLAALVNWLARFPLSMLLPFEQAVVAAYAVGMTFGYIVYRRYVFRRGDAPVWSQIVRFLLVNAVGVVVVAVVASALANVLAAHVVADRSVAEAIAHGLAIGTSAVTSFIGHKWFTFAQSSRSPARL